MGIARFAACFGGWGGSGLRRPAAWDECMEGSSARFGLSWHCRSRRSTSAGSGPSTTAVCKRALRALECRCVASKGRCAQRGGLLGRAALLACIPTGRPAAWRMTIHARPMAIHAWQMKERTGQRSDRRERDEVRPCSVLLKRNAGHHPRPPPMNCDGAPLHRRIGLWASISLGTNRG